MRTYELKVVETAERAESRMAACAGAVATLTFGLRSASRPT